MIFGLVGESSENPSAAPQANAYLAYVMVAVGEIQLEAADDSASDFDFIAAPVLRYTFPVGNDQELSAGNIGVGHLERERIIVILVVQRDGEDPTAFGDGELFDVMIRLG